MKKEIEILYRLKESMEVRFATLNAAAEGQEEPLLTLTGALNELEYQIKELSNIIRVAEDGGNVLFDHEIPF